MPISDDVQLGEGVVVHHPSLVNLYGCQIGDVREPRRRRVDVPQL